MYDEYQFFKRDYDLAQSYVAAIDRDSMQIIADTRTPLYPEGGILHIYGMRIPHDELDDHDRAVVKRQEASGFIFTRCWSTMEPDYGDIGSQPVSECTPISQEEFLAAKARGWRPK